MGMTPPVEFTLSESDIHFFRRGKDSFLQISAGNTILQLFISDVFSLKADLNANGEMILIAATDPLPDPKNRDSKFIDFNSDSTGFLIAANAGGIGIADIRDGMVKLNAVLFSLHEVQLFCRNSRVGTGSVELLFSPKGLVTDREIP